MDEEEGRWITAPELVHDPAAEGAGRVPPQGKETATHYYKASLKGKRARKGKGSPRTTAALEALTAVQEQMRSVKASNALPEQAIELSPDGKA